MICIPNPQNHDNTVYLYTRNNFSGFFYHSVMLATLYFTFTVSIYQGNTSESEGYTKFTLPDTENKISNHYTEKIRYIDYTLGPLV